MKATTAYKMKLVADAVRKGIVASVSIRGVGTYRVLAARDQKHSVLLTLADKGGFIATDPDEIVSVWVQELPPAFQESHLHAD